MKRILTALPFLIFLTIYSVFSQPHLEIIGGDTYDWKRVKTKDSPLKADIELKNTGNEKLIISKVRPTCGCTTAPLDKTELEPGETTIMHVKLNIGRRSGHVSKAINITSNDPKAKRKVLRLKADAYSAIEVKPRTYFSFNEMNVGQTKSASLKIKNNSNKKVKLSDYIVQPDNLSINLKKDMTIEPGGEIELIAKITPDKKGYLNCTVKMKTSHPDHPELRITGFGNVQESVIFNSK